VTVTEINEKYEAEKGGGDGEDGDLDVLQVFTDDSGYSLHVYGVHSEQQSRDPGCHGSAPMRRQGANPSRESSRGGSMQQGVKHVEATCRPVTHATASQKHVEAKGEDGERAIRAVRATVRQWRAPEITAQQVQQRRLRQHVVVGKDGATAKQFRGWCSCNTVQRVARLQHSSEGGATAKQFRGWCNCNTVQRVARLQHSSEGGATAT